MLKPVNVFTDLDEAVEFMSYLGHPDDLSVAGYALLSGGVIA